MERKAEDPTGYLPTLHSLVFYAGNPKHVLCEWNVFLTRWSVVIPLELAMVETFMGKCVDHRDGVVEWEAAEICLERENLVVTAGEVCQDTRSWIRGPEVMKDAEETPDGHRCKLF